MWATRLTYPSGREHRYPRIGKHVLPPLLHRLEQGQRGLTQLRAVPRLHPQRPDALPRLAGQREEYLLKSLRGYKDNSRHGYDAQMADVVATLNDADFVDLAHYLARQK